MINDKDSQETMPAVTVTVADVPMTAPREQPTETIVIRTDRNGNIADLAIGGDIFRANPELILVALTEAFFGTTRSMPEPTPDQMAVADFMVDVIIGGGQAWAVATGMRWEGLPAHGLITGAHGLGGLGRGLQLITQKLERDIDQIEEHLRPGIRAMAALVREEIEKSAIHAAQAATEGGAA